MAKLRVTVTLDESLIEEAKTSVLEGRSASISALVGEALRARLEDDARLRALRDAIETYEAAHGAFTSEEMADLEHRDRLAVDALEARVRKAG